MADSYDVAVVGAGIAGVSAAYFLSVRHGLRTVLVDHRPPLTLTSDKSTECYRNWWPGPGPEMVAFMNRSIDLLEEWALESANAFNLNRRGYLFVTGDPDRLALLRTGAEETSNLGGGPLRCHPGGQDAYRESPAGGWEGQPTGADLFEDGHSLRRWFPYVSGRAVGGVHVRRAGWLSAQQLGAYLLEKGRDAGLAVLASQVVGIEGQPSPLLTLADGSRLRPGATVIAAGPMTNEVLAMVGATLPLHSELHRKIAFRDHLNVIPREAPLVIWSDPQRLPWSAEEAQWLAADVDGQVLMEELPGSPHFRPEGGVGSNWVLALWEFRRDRRAPVWPLPDDPVYTEVIMRGLATLVPGLGGYLERLPRALVDGGYYMKTAENRHLVGPTDIGGVCVVAGLSGFGVMAAAAAGELVGLHLTGGELPDYAWAFLPSRYQDPRYVTLMGNQQSSGQL